MTSTVKEKPVSAKEQEAAFLLQAELAEGLRTETGLLPEFANEIAGRLTRFLRLRLGTQAIYIPAPDRTERDAAIFREFDGKNAAAVMRRHGVSRSRLYQVVDEQRALKHATSPVSSLKTGQSGA